MMDKSEERYLKSLEKLVKLEEIKTFPKYVNLKECSELKEYKNVDTDE